MKNMFINKGFLILLAFVVVNSVAPVAQADSALIPGYWDNLLANGGLFGLGNNTAGLFGGPSQTERLVQTNCKIRYEDNPFSGQLTPQTICDDKIQKGISYGGTTVAAPVVGSAYYSAPTAYYSAPAYSAPIVYTPTYAPVVQNPYNGYYTGYNGGNNFSASNYLLSAFNGNGYGTGSNGSAYYNGNGLNSWNGSMITTYYGANDGWGRDVGFYQPGCQADGYCQQYDTRSDNYYGNGFISSNGNVEIDRSGNIYGYTDNTESDYYRAAQEYGRQNGLTPGQVDELYYTGVDAYDPNAVAYEIYTH